MKKRHASLRSSESIYPDGTIDTPRTSSYRATRGTIAPQVHLRSSYIACATDSIAGASIAHAMSTLGSLTRVIVARAWRSRCKYRKLRKLRDSAKTSRAQFGASVNSPLRGVARSRGVKSLPSLERRTLDRWNQNTPGTHASSFACVILRLIRVDPSTSPCLAQARSVRSEVCCQGSSCVVQICRNRRNRTIRTVRDYNDTRCGLAAAQSGTDIGETATLASGSLGFSLCVELRQVSSSLVRSRQVPSVIRNCVWGAVRFQRTSCWSRG